jgi:4-amino-4-deoxy-L-arabinose transferase-like glycosyltransferase
VKGHQPLSNRAISFSVVLIILLTAAYLRLSELSILPTGLNSEEITNVRIIETIRAGGIELFYDIGDETTYRGREPLYQMMVASVTTFTGSGSLGYRMLSVWTGLLTVAVIYATARRITGYFGALSASALFAFSFSTVLLSRQVTPSVILPLLVIGTLTLLMQILPIYRRRWHRGNIIEATLLLGVLLGLGIYIHPIGWLVIAINAGFIIYMLRTRGKIASLQVSRRRNGYLALLLFIVLIPCIPYLLSSIRNPELSGFQRIISDNLGNYSPQNTINSIGGLIFAGDPSPLRNLPNRPLFDPISAFVMVIGLGWSLFHWREPRYTLLLFAFVILSPTFLFSVTAPNFDNYAPILPILALFFAIGIHHLQHYAPKQLKPVIMLATAGLFVFNANWTAGDLQNWRDHPEVQTAHRSNIGQLAAYIDRTSHEIPTVICGWRAYQAPSIRDLTNAQLITVLLNRGQNANIRYADCYNAMILVAGGEGQQIIIPSTHVLDHAQAPIQAWLDYGEFITRDDVPDSSVMMLEVEQELADFGGLLINGRTVSYAPEAGGTLDQRYHTPLQFAGNLTLLGYMMPPSNTYQAGDNLSLDTYWRIDGGVPSDLRLFSHILYDPSSRPVANTDVTHVNPRFLRSRDIVIQVTSIPIPQSLPSGEYDISIGAYQDASEVRLSVLDQGQIRGTRLFLDRINIQTAETP